METFLSPPKESRLKLLTLSFPEETEEEFLEEYFRKSLRHVRLALLLAIGFYAAFGVLDAWLVPEFKATLWLIRYAAFLPLAFGIFLFTFSSRFKEYMQLSITVVILAAGFGIIAMVVIAPYPINYSYYAGLILVFIFGYTFFKLRFIWATLAGWTIVIVYEISAIWLSETPLPVLINNNFFFLGGNIIGMFACYSIEFYSRKEFIHARLLEEEKRKVKSANVDLEKRVEQRTDQLMLSIKKLRSEVAERKKAEEALKTSEERFRSLSENSPEIIYDLDRHGAFTYVNPAWEEILGHTPEEVLGKYFVDFAEKEKSGLYVKRFKEIRDKKQTLRDVRGVLIGKDGKSRLFNLSGAPNIDSQGNVSGMVGLLIDVTEQQRLQSQLQQAQKMEAIGTLAGGVAHDFNNLLQAVLGYSDLLLLSKKRDEPECGHLLEIKRAALRGADLSQQLLTFSRKVESKLRPIDLNHQVRETQRFLERMLPKMILIETRLTKDLWTINGDPTQVDQVIMNLAVNARDAMPEGGKILIETENLFLHEDYCKEHLETAPGPHVLLTLSDTGDGIEKESLPNIFEPFYTTKEVGKGTGLGLSIVYGIVKNHGGQVTCYSEPGEGTVFKIYLPVIENTVKLSVEEEEETVQGGDEKILLVDDEEGIRNLGVQLLEMHGYSVLAAENGEEALAIYQKEKERIDLVILDLIMPGMGGRRCLEELLRLNPQVHVLIASGYSMNGPTRAVIEAGAKGFIRKPYDIRKMLQVVRKTLDCAEGS
jgi:two-component system, cell cycle sensor histidine kinase and response regulator CckA